MLQGLDVAGLAVQLVIAAPGRFVLEDVPVLHARGRLHHIQGAAEGQHHPGKELIRPRAEHGHPHQVQGVGAQRVA
jgi:hypothetical protein